MAESWRAMRSRSAAVRSSRARWATQATWSGVNIAPPLRLAARLRRAAKPIGSNVRHLERLALVRLLDQPAADGADGDADRLDLAVDLDLHPLQVRQEPPLGAAGDLTADAAEVLGLAAVPLLVAA